VRAFPFLCNAVDRSLAAPDEVLRREQTSDPRNVILVHHYTPAERGQILAFSWWVYANKSRWDREELRAAVIILSPLMMFSSTFFEEMSGIPGSTVKKIMVKPPQVSASRVTGTCDMVVIHRLLETAAQGMTEYREAVRELSVAKGIPSAMLSRISGVPKEILARPERGINFFAEKPDFLTDRVVTVRQRIHYMSRNPQERRGHDAQPGNQRTVRDALAGTYLGDFRATHAPVPDDGSLPYHFAIPGLPVLREGDAVGIDDLRRVQEWQMLYHLPASAALGSARTSQHP
jgi:hypothetical protein